MKIYRIENESTNHGMWYKDDGTYDPFIMRLTEGKSKHLPMEFEERYSKGGVKWFSGCHSMELMKQWFSALDALELLQSGYKLYTIESNQFIEEEDQILFTREGIVHKHEIELDDIWDLSELKAN